MQVIITLLIIGAAVAYLGIQFYRRFFAKETKCDGCGLHKEMR